MERNTDMFHEWIIELKRLSNNETSEYTAEFIRACSQIVRLIPNKKIAYNPNPVIFIIPEKPKEKIEKHRFPIRLTDIEYIRGLFNTAVKYYNRGNIVAFKKISQLANSLLDERKKMMFKLQLDYRLFPID